MEDTALLGEDEVILLFANHVVPLPRPTSFFEMTEWFWLRLCLCLLLLGFAHPKVPAKLMLTWGCCWAVAFPGPGRTEGGETPLYPLDCIKQHTYYSLLPKICFKKWMLMY